MGLIPDPECRRVQCQQGCGVRLMRVMPPSLRGRGKYERNVPCTRPLSHGARTSSSARTYVCERKHVGTHEGVGRAGLPFSTAAYVIYIFFLSDRKSKCKKSKIKCKCNFLLLRRQCRRNVTKGEGASETSIPSRAKTNPSMIYFYADLCSPRPGESFP